MVTTYRAQEIKLSFVRSKRPAFRPTNSSQVALAFKSLCKEVRESIYAIYLTSANGLIGIERVSTGTIADATAEPAEVLRTALVVGATAIIMVHNHPSGSPTPSSSDYAITRRIYDTAKLFNIRLLDHIIIGNNGRYFSFADDGVLPIDGTIPLSRGRKQQKITVKN